MLKFKCYINEIIDIKIEESDLDFSKAMQTNEFYLCKF